MERSTQPPYLTYHDLVHIVNRASTLHERMAAQPGPSHPDETALCPEHEDPAEARVITKRLERWCQAATGGDWQRFERRLDWDGYTLQTIRPLLGSHVQLQCDSLPEWVQTLDECVKAVSEVNGNEQPDAYPFLLADDPIPFEELFIPFVLWARQHLQQCLGSRATLLSVQAYARLERILLEMLGMRSAQALHLEFSLFRAQQETPFGRLAGRLNSDLSTELYQRFIADMRDGRIAEFYKEYTVLGRESATLVNSWVEVLAEFCARLEADRETIADRFNHKQAIGEVTEIQMGVSDRHNGGRSVLMLRFASGLKLVYKPTDLTAAACFTDLFAWLNQQQGLLPFKAPTIVNCASYGWVEFIEHTPCPDFMAAARFFLRMGMLTCLLYVLGGADFHYENSIADGEYPVLIDLETLFQPSAPTEEERLGHLSAEAVASKHLWNSVLRTAVLPRWKVGAEYASYDISGLGGFDQQETRFKTIRWRHINTDHMLVEPFQPKIQAEANLPISGGNRLNPDEFVEEFVTGFTQMYLLLSENRKELLAPEGPLVGFRQQRVRFLMRATRVYTALQQKANHPEYLRDGIDKSIAFEALARAFAVTPTLPLAWPVLQAEHQALAQLDIPYFTTCTSGTTLQSGPNQSEVKMNLPGFFEEPGYDHAVTVINNLGQNDLAKQLALIRAAFCAQAATLTFKRSEAESNLPNQLETAVTPHNREALLQEAFAIATELRKQAFYGNNGSVNWITVEYDLRMERFQLQVLRPSLYNGTPGIGVFLAALEKTTGGAGYRDLALGTVLGLREDPFKATLVASLGGMVGVGALIYALVRMSDFLGDCALLNDARLIAETVTPERIKAEPEVDVVMGCSGAALAFLALYQRTRDETYLHQATWCGHQLVQRRVSTPTGQLAWQFRRGPCLTGFSHGAAGISYALLKLYAATGEQAFLDAALSGLDYERRVFLPEAGNWPDLREQDETGVPGFMTSWCHGATGIGLGRLGALHVLNTPETLSEIEVALATTQRYGLQGVDHLCCGSAGRIDLLLEASRRLQRPELASQARQWMGQIVASANQNRAYNFHIELPSSLFHPGLFRGMAGIGYELLRLAEDGETLPSVLLLD